MWYEVLLFVHILAASVWWRHHAALIGARVQRTGDGAYRARFAKSAGVIGPVTGVSALLVGAGIGMILDSEPVAFTDL